MRKTGFLYGALLLVLGTMLVFATTGTAAGTASFKAAWIYVGPHNDGGWSQAHDEGRLSVQKQLGSKVQTTFKENVPEGAQIAQVIESLSATATRSSSPPRSGSRLHGAGGEEAPGRLLRDGDRNAAVEEHGRVLRRRRGRDLPRPGWPRARRARRARSASSSPFAIPEVIRHTNAFTLGVQATHPRRR